MRIFNSTIGNKKSFNFLVIGAGRGGTSLLAGLLDSHSQLTVGLERFAFDYLLGEALDKKKDSLRIRVRSFMKACERESRVYKNWGNKITTEQIHALSDAPDIYHDNWQEYFCEHVLMKKKIIYIIRDGRTCIRSKINRTGQDYQTALERWKYSVDLYRFLKNRPLDIYILRMEDLILEPSKTLEDACAFLNLPYEEGMLAGTANEKMEKDYRQKGIDKSVIDVRDIPVEWLEDMKGYEEFLQ